MVPVLGDEPGAGGERRGYAARPGLPPGDVDLARRCRSQSYDGLGDLGAPAAVGAREADDLAGTDLEADVVVRVTSQSADAQRGRGTGSRVLGRTSRRSAAASPVMAATRSARLSSATGAVTMCRASRKTVTVSQIS